MNTKQRLKVIEDILDNIRDNHLSDLDTRLGRVEGAQKVIIGLVLLVLGLVSGGFFI